MNELVINAVCAAVVLGEGENFEPMHLEPREARQAIAAYLSAIGAGERDKIIGNLLDRWEMTPNDLKQEMREHSCGKQLDELSRHVETPQIQPRATIEHSPDLASENERLREALDRT